MNNTQPFATRFSLTRRLLLTITAGLWMGSAIAQSHPLRIILGYPPGGSTDLVARILQPQLSAELGVPVIIENKAGANGTIGVDAVAKAAPDGNTLLLVSASPLVVAPHVMKTPFSTTRDLAPITMIGRTPEALAVPVGSRVTTLAQLIEQSKVSDIRIASSGIGGLPHLTIELLKSLTGGRVVHVPYKGGGPAITDTIGGHVDAVVLDLAALVPHFKSGTLRPLVVTSEQRDPFMPDVPSAKEAGLGGFEAVNWVGVFAPAKTPAPVIARLHDALVKVVAMPAVADKLRKDALQPITSASPAEFTQFVASEDGRWGKVARAAGLNND